MIKNDEKIEKFYSYEIEENFSDMKVNNTSVKPVKPARACFLYYDVEKINVKREFPNMKINERYAVMAQRWADLSLKDKTTYIQTAKRAKQRYRLELRMWNQKQKEIELKRKQGRELDDFNDAHLKMNDIDQKIKQLYDMMGEAEIIVCQIKNMIMYQKKVKLYGE